ncbi:hypothetical protein HY492_00700 [Candidatus Woesearchaeota archaeon]|nr:hypothetical protein [Candidatus Woesearchaeota archaeon]
MRRLFKFQYPKLVLLVIAILLAYWIFSRPDITASIVALGGMQYLGIFIAGLLFAFGFTTPFAVGFFLIAAPSNPVLAAMVGGLGALISDVVIFGTIKLTFMDEFRRIKHSWAIRSIDRFLTHGVNGKLRVYLTYAFAGFVIASPLPDELGVSLLAGFSKLHPLKFALISYACNTIGILVMLLL